MTFIRKTVLASLLLTFATGAMALKELNVAYFLEWPTPNQIADVEKTFEKRMGIKVNWKAFDNGNAMTNAMVAGDIDIAYSQGFVPFVVAVSKGVDLKLVGVAMTYAENDNCVVRNGTNITKANAKALEGKTIGSPIGNVTHYKLLSTLKHLGVDRKKVKILSMQNSDVPAALARGDIDMGCGFGGSLVRMKQHGSVLMTGAEQEAIGLKVFDIVSVPGKFLKENRKVVEQFMEITEDANLNYNRSPERFYNVLAKASGMDKGATIDTLNKFGFLSRSEQLTGKWMLGGVQRFTKEVAEFFVENKVIPRARSQEHYNSTVDTSVLANIK